MNLSSEGGRQDKKLINLSKDTQNLLYLKN